MKTRRLSILVMAALTLRPVVAAQVGRIISDDYRLAVAGKPINQGVVFDEPGTIRDFLLRDIAIPDSQGGMSVPISAQKGLPGSGTQPFELMLKPDINRIVFTVAGSVQTSPQLMKLHW